MDKAFTTAAVLLAATFALAMTATDGEAEEVVTEVVEEVVDTEIGVTR